MNITKTYLAFMDHSISEQLIGDPNAWHTSSIILSEGNEVSNLARVIAKSTDPKKQKLKKWSARRGQRKTDYRKKFAQELVHQLPGSGVFVFSSSATEKIIEESRDHIVRELRISHLCNEEENNGKKRIVIGPFNKTDSDDKHYFTFSLNRALMLFWIVHFVCRMHKMFQEQLVQTETKNVFLDWFFYLDKFAGDSKDSSPSLSLFNILVTGNISNGNVRSGFFNESDVVEADIFADNVAGLFNDMKLSPENYSSLDDLYDTGCIHYETS